MVSQQNFIMIGGPMATARSGLLRLADLLERHGDQGFAAVGAVVGADDQLVGDGAHLVLEDDQVAGRGRRG